MTVTIVDAAGPVLGGADTQSDLNVTSCLVTGGVDTHLDLNVAAALDRVGGLLAVRSFPPPWPGTVRCWAGWPGWAGMASVALDIAAWLGRRCDAGRL